jgi:hypothetical protein
MLACALLVAVVLGADNTLQRDFPSFLAAWTQCMSCAIEHHELTRDTKFTVWAGTLLGAVRDAAFIPWDVDADFAVAPQDLPAVQQLAQQWQQHGFSALASAGRGRCAPKCHAGLAGATAGGTRHVTNSTNQVQLVVYGSGLVEGVPGRYSIDVYSWSADTPALARQLGAAAFAPCSINHAMLGPVHTRCVPSALAVQVLAHVYGRAWRKQPYSVFDAQFGWVGARDGAVHVIKSTGRSADMSVREAREALLAGELVQGPYGPAHRAAERDAEMSWRRGAMQQRQQRQQQQQQQHRRERPLGFVVYGYHVLLGVCAACLLFTCARRSARQRAVTRRGYQW